MYKSSREYFRPDALALSESYFLVEQEIEYQVMVEGSGSKVQKQTRQDLYALSIMLLEVLVSELSLFVPYEDYISFEEQLKQEICSALEQQAMAQTELRKRGKQRISSLTLLILRAYRGNLIKYFLDLTDQPMGADKYLFALNAQDTIARLTALLHQ